MPGGRGFKDCVVELCCLAMCLLVLLMAGQMMMVWCWLRVWYIESYPEQCTIALCVKPERSM